VVVRNFIKFIIPKFLIPLVFALLVDGAFAILEIEITKGADNAIPIAIAPLINEEKLLSSSDSITAVIANDLKNSGRFRHIHITPESNALDFTHWKTQKVEAVLTGQITSSGADNYKVTFSLFDVYSHKKLIEKEYNIKTSQLRKLAHHISDIVYEQLLGDRGIFSTKIAYVLVNRRGKLANYHLQIADSDGYNTHTLLSSRFPLMSPSWSPDGKKISYVSFEGHRAAIYIQEIATGKREVLAKFPGINGAPAWSPDGSKMAMVLTKTGYPKIYTMDLKTKNLEQITDGWYLDTEPSWSPDGKSIIFTSNRGGNPQIYMVHLGTKKIERLTFNGSYNARAHFLPNNKNAIIMLHKASGMFTIALQNLNSGQLTLLAPLGRNESPSIAPNGKMIIYATNQANRGILAAASIDGRVKLLLPTIDGEVQEPAWSPFF
jgi:TolB protein